MLASVVNQDYQNNTYLLRRVLQENAKIPLTGKKNTLSIPKLNFRDINEAMEWMMRPAIKARETGVTYPYDEDEAVLEQIVDEGL